MSDFHSALVSVLITEGSYSKSPQDRGGETYKGIARNIWPDWDGWAIIDQVSKKSKGFVKALDDNDELQELVKSFYKVNFWDVLQLDKIESQEVAFELFDTAINQGVSTAGRHFQYCLNLLNSNGEHYPDLLVDGKIGKYSLEAYEAFLKTSAFKTRSAAGNISAIVKALNGIQFSNYVQICKSDPAQEVHFLGWLSRC